MDEGLLQLPQVGGGGRRRLEVPVQAVAHRAHQSSPVSASSSYSRRRRHMQREGNAGTIKTFQEWKGRGCLKHEG
jgi:hypothetical protein